MEFKGCKHLSFEKEKFPSCKIIKLYDIACWERKNVDEKLVLCQFCKLRGRINDPFYCTEKELSSCDEFEEITQTVNVEV